MSRSQMVYFTKKNTEKTVIKSYFETTFLMFPEYIYKSLDIFTKIIIAISLNYNEPVAEIDD